MKQNYYFTSESVSEGHPDKVADQISDSVLDAAIKIDPKARVACETLTTTGLVLISGEFSNTVANKINYPKIARNTLKEIGYTDPSFGIDAATCSVLLSIDEQSPDISQGVTEGTGLHSEQGAGDQGMMFGYACNETPEYMPAPIYYAHRLVEKLAEIRKAGEKMTYLRPDSKSQVTVEYVNDKPSKVHTIVISTQHSDDVTLDKIKEDVINIVVPEVIPAELIADDIEYHVNPTGKFVVGGPHGDTGLTGRKIIVDTYGGMGRHGGGAFSGKDPSKVDRSAAYMTRYIAKNVVAAGLADRCEIQVSYAIGLAKPLSVFIDTFGTNKVDETKIENAIKEIFDLTPKGIITSLNLLNPIYFNTAKYGHFGRCPDSGCFTWESLDKVDALKTACN